MKLIFLHVDKRQSFLQADIIDGHDQAFSKYLK